MLTRAAIAVGLIVGCGLYARGATGPEHPVPRRSLAAMPLTLGEWHGAEARALSDDVLGQLGVDDYINRHYVSASMPPVSVYIGYYRSQRQGDTIHSPQNCLPGAGWRPILSERDAIHAGNTVLPVNRFVIQKGMDRQAVLYWYQGRGRIVANEFANKGWLMLDAARLRRTDGGLVRLIAPVTSTADAAFASLTSFSAALVPHLWSYLPCHQDAH